MVSLGSTDTEKMWSDLKTLESKFEKLESPPEQKVSPMLYASKTDILATQHDIESLQSSIKALRLDGMQETKPSTLVAESVYKSPLTTDTPSLADRVLQVENQVSLAENQILILKKFVKNMHQFISHNSGAGAEVPKVECNYCIYCPSLCSKDNDRFIHQENNAPAIGYLA